MSRLCDRFTRRASPGLDTDLSGLGLGFIYPGNVRFSRNTLPISSILAFSTTRIHLSSVTGSLCSSEVRLRENSLLLVSSALQVKSQSCFWLLTSEVFPFKVASNSMSRCAGRGEM